jgi:carotenoid 1,2-hydratase
VFSPYYRRAFLRDASTSPDEHCAINVCLYSPGATRWTMTERCARHVQREARDFVIGPSRVGWRDDALHIDIDERSAPLPRAVRGTLRLRPQGLSRFVAALDARGLHRWGPIAPCARIEVQMQSPALRWSGAAYFDSNEGDEPIERAFTRWDWLRTAPAADGASAVLYDVLPRDERRGASRLLAQRFHADGSASPFEAASRQALPATPLWRVARQVRAGEAPARVLHTLEDTPFYARSLIELALPGGPRVAAVHETLDVTRLRSPVVQAMLPFRMPRRG